MEVTNFPSNFTNATTRISTNLPALGDCNLPVGECDKVLLAKRVTLAVNIAVILFTIVCIIILGKYKNFLERIVCHLLLANLLSAIVMIIGDGRPEDEGTPWCIAQAFLIQLFDFSECVWCFNFTLFLFLLMMKKKDTKCHERYYTLGAWGISTINACLPFIKDDVYGPASAPFCWITEKYSATWRFAVYWIPVCIMLVLMLVAFIYMTYIAQTQWINFQPRRNEKAQQSIKALVDGYLKPVTAYFALFFFISMFQVANRVQNGIGNPVTIFVIIHVISISSLSIALSLLFFVTIKEQLTKENFHRGLTDIYINFTTCGRKVKTPDQSKSATKDLGNKTPDCEAAETDTVTA